MTARTRRIFHAANACVCTGGLLYAAFKWLLTKPPNEFGTPIHPWEPGLKAAHILFAPLLVFAIGWIWRAHVASQLRHGVRQKRSSGLFLVMLAAPMILSGGGFQVSVEASTRALWSQAHLWASLLWVLGSILHLGKKNK